MDAITAAILILTLSLSSFPSLSAAAPCKPESCHAVLGPEIRFPFRVLNRQSASCGSLGFELRCNPQNQTILTLPESGSFVVDHIDYAAQALFINDPDSCLPGRILNFSASGSPFRGAYTRRYTFLNCSSDFMDYGSTRYTPLYCLSGRNHTVLATRSDSSAPAPETCRRIKSVEVPLEWTLSQFEWASMDLREDLELVWYDPLCRDCEIGGGICGFKDDRPGSRVACFRRSRSVLDLSSNNLTGTIPPCLLKKNVVSEVLDLRGNNIDGVIPDQFSSECQLKTFDVSHNKLGGKIPKSLANCKELVVMDVGNNNLDDGFPCTLPLSLQVLVLRSNRFHGDLRCHQSWPNLQILDISSNNFSGTLDPLNFTSWRGMMMLERVRAGRQSFLESVYSYYRNELTLTIKGVEVQLVKIWPDFTSIDLSCNHFEGEIPYAIGNLSSLYLLNLSHNALTGAIPRSLGDLTDLGSLDLSANQLRGRIPEELAKLTFLSVLNVSHNDITGMIPTGTQFQTFSADSFEGNNGLCGFPLNRSCSNTSHGSGSTPSKSKHEEIEWEYVFVALGYVVGLGSIVWTFLCCRRLRERYFEKIEEVVDEILDRKARRRRVERRNEVRRRHQRV